MPAVRVTAIEAKPSKRKFGATLPDRNSGVGEFAYLS